MAYGPDHLIEPVVATPADLRPLLGAHPMIWVDIDGLGDVEFVRGLAAVFGIHPLAQEDMVNTYQRAKVEPYGDHLFLVSRMLTLQDGGILNEQLSLYFGPGFLLSFQEIPGDCLDPVRARLRQGGPMRERGSDHLAYALLDAVIDGYFPVLETCGDRLEELEEEILARPSPGAVRRIHEVRRQLIVLRRAVWPLREAVNSLLRESHPRLTDETRLFLRDCYDHTVQILDLVETYRELSSDLTDVYLSSIGQRTNEIMRLLTVISTVFIPLTFLVGLWGMNFDPDSSPWNMPELRWRWGYPIALALILGVAIGMFWLFLRRGWLGPPGSRDREHDSERGDDGRLDSPAGSSRKAG
jgi:magnesium transporter